MLLTIDVGNTQTLLGLFEGPESGASKDIVEHWRVATDARRTADELAVLLHGLLEQSPIMNGTRISGIALCSTVPSVLHEIRDMCRRYYADVPTVIVAPGVRTGMPVHMDNPKEVGSDRIVNALAAAYLYGGPCIVVDFGTATNFDVVNARGEYVGGALAPGIEISVDALGARGAQLFKVELARPRSVVAKNTAEALQSGIVYGFAGQVDGIIQRMIGELLGQTVDEAREVTVVSTGGLASLVTAETTAIDVYEPWLTLIGLRLVYERNMHSVGD